LDATGKRVSHALKFFLETCFENLGNTGFFLHEVESHLMTGWGIYVFTTLPGDGWRVKYQFIEDNIVLCAHRLLYRHADCCPPSPAARNRPLRGSYRASSQALFRPVIHCRRW